MAKPGKKKKPARAKAPAAKKSPPARKPAKGEPRKASSPKPSSPKPSSPKPSSPKPKASKPAAPPAAPPTPPPPAPSSSVQASAAERKAAVAALAQDSGIDRALAKAPWKRPAAEPSEPAVPAGDIPEFVKAASPADRKAAVQALMSQEIGQSPVLAKAPWRRAEIAPGPKAPAPPPPPLPPAVTKGRMPAPPPPAPAPGAAPATPMKPAGVKRPVLVDTNALMMQFQFHIDIEKELRRILDFAHEIAVPTTVLEELKAITESAPGKDAGEARMALELAKTFRVLESPGEGDTAILRLAEKLNAVVVTNDKILRARLRAKDIPNIYMRSKAFLTIEGHVTGV